MNVVYEKFWTIVFNLPKARKKAERRSWKERKENAKISLNNK